MDEAWFDDLARGMTEGMNRRRARRGVLAGLAALTALGGVGWGELDGVAAKPKRKKKKKCKGGKKRCGKQCVNLQTDAGHCGSCTTVCAENEICQAGACGPKECGTGADCLVFVTAQQFYGDLEGISGADDMCGLLATNAGRPGTFMAWLSDSTVSPSTRFTRNPGQYVLTTGEMVAADWAALTSGTLAHAIDRDQDGNASQWSTKTNTRPDGTAASTTQTCANWTLNSGVNGAGGSTSYTDGRWTQTPGEDGVCGGNESLYCFQQSGPGFVLEPQ